MRTTSAPTSMQDLRQHNYHTVLLAIEEASCGISRTQLSQKTSLSPASITLICEDLLQKGIVTEVESAFALTGRKPKLLKIAPSGGMAAALIIDSTHKASLAFSNMDYQLLFRKQISFSSEEDLIRQAVTSLSRQEGPLMGLGIAISQEYSWEENCSRAVHGIDPDKMAEAFRKALPLTVEWIDHDRMCLESYLHFFQKIPCENPVYLQFDDSISAAALSGAGGDLGHITFGYDGDKSCYCGKTGCARRYCSPGILVGYLRKADSDPHLSDKIDSYADALLALCDSAARIYGSDCLVFGGEMTYFSELLNPILARKMAESDNPLLHRLILEITDQQDILELKGTLRLAVRSILRRYHWETARTSGSKEASL